MNVLFGDLRLELRLQVPNIGSVTSERPDPVVAVHGHPVINRLLPNTFRGLTEIHQDDLAFALWSGMDTLSELFDKRLDTMNVE